ncbi:HNH endonuclease [Bacillus tropicus]|uniref:HNH endonuclease n=1 Tax=Bacillus cereus group TaxID=86661 RepID=UPI0021D175EC|nr:MULTISPECIES: HNH endonuclease [Bacillus cereus group]MCU5173709.1 HNH endonuclease [Bacillus paranthracis]MCU5425714.1 HNH endonuclease [Bacillus tropicus]
MKKETYEHIKKYIHLLDIDYENGVILNRKSQVVKPGYAKVKFKQKMIGVHQIISFLKYGKKNVGLNVNHIDGDKLNNKPSNLEVVTQSENILHAFRTGLKQPAAPKGEGNAFSKLTDNEVREIKSLLDKGLMKKDIAAKFNIDPSTISRINSGTRWAHIK